MPKKQGLASLSKAKRTEIARLGGKIAHIYGVAHEFNSQEAREAGIIGRRRKARNRQRHLVS